MPVRLFALPGALLAIALVTGCAPAETAGGGPEVQESQRFSGEAAQPRRHFRVQNPAELTADEAARIYSGLADDLAAVYARSGDPVTLGYRQWQRFNSTPYRSMTHGRRYVSNYANAIARDYGKYEAAGRLPLGSVVAKDSFAVTDDGTVSAGPLFVMEKMEAGFNYVSGDWRYSMISAEGVLLGRTKGPGAERVEFCVACHLAVEKQDHLFFVPEQVRLSP